MERQSRPKLTIRIRREQNYATAVNVKGEDDIEASATSNIRGQDDVCGSTSPGLQDTNIREQNDLTSSTLHGRHESTPQRHTEATSSREDKDCISISDNEDDLNCSTPQNQLVVYNPSAGEIEAVADPVDYLPPAFPRYGFHNHSSRILPSVGAFTVQCAICFKWRLIPSKEKYEEIREHITEQPFVCEAAREWRPEISCEDEPDITQDGSRLWAIDKPNIAQPPPGWERLLRIRAEGGTRFADVYYVAPSGKRFRSMVEIQRYILEHPLEAEGVSLSQFSFQTPKPLQENYVRKRPTRPASLDGSPFQLPGDFESSEANPLSWIGPNENTDLRLGVPGYSSTYRTPVFEHLNRPSKKSRMPSMQTYNNGYMYGDGGYRYGNNGNEGGRN